MWKKKQKHFANQWKNTKSVREIENVEDDEQVNQ